jgi:hypothetical protein
LNRAGYHAAIVPWVDSAPDRYYEPKLDWDTPLYLGPVDDSIVIYPEIVPENPLGAEHVVRWALHYPGRMGGDAFFSDDELVFAYDEMMLPRVNCAVRKRIGKERVLTVPVIDPNYIYPDPTVDKVVDCIFTHKGKELSEQFPLPNRGNLLRVEEHSPTMQALGDLLRRTRTLYSYDHETFLLIEAVICGCEILVIHEGGQLLDPRVCGCVLNMDWNDDVLKNYAVEFDNPQIMHAFIKEIAKQWPDLALGLRPDR